MMSLTRTLLDPHEVASRVAYRPCLPTLVDETEWFDRSSIALVTSCAVEDLVTACAVEESNEPPPWTPEPVDRRWRARGWTDDD
jgi:hypothetical protein